MAVARIEWRCPRCEKRYAIREDIPEPELCPACQQAQPDSELPAIDPHYAAQRIRRHRSLRIVAQGIKAAAVLIAVGGFLFFTLSIVQGTPLITADDRLLVTAFYLAAFFGTLLNAALIYAAGGALELLIEIEHHTRLQRAASERK
ncbi:hypothetical protein Mal4_05020 [Maioricimonas rarisocia]|uniref:Uncharacterized protein n=1 Tax=Maioricimonas rarisocia TaxID=2528026 RepID=A0A517Z166_9PLAN|nr:hypothetical protein [Maioricimonas rarisocia]QDU36218.1 hypothetical protein Mal4_05020 [Maioricimonas rarisocia]